QGELNVALQVIGDRREQTPEATKRRSIIHRDMHQCVIPQTRKVDASAMFRTGDRFPPNSLIGQKLRCLRIKVEFFAVDYYVPVGVLAADINILNYAQPAGKLLQVGPRCKDFFNGLADLY